MDVVIAEEHFAAGFQLKATAYFLGHKFSINVEIGLIFLKVKGHAHSRTIKFGPLELTGWGCDLIKGNADDGVCLDISLGIKPASFHIRFSGTFSAFGFFRVEAHMSLSKSGLFLKFNMEFGTMASATIQLWTNDLASAIQQPPDATKSPVRQAPATFGTKTTTSGWSPPVPVGRRLLSHAETGDDRKWYENDLHLKIVFKQKLLDWLADQVDTCLSTCLYMCLYVCVEHASTRVYSVYARVCAHVCARLCARGYARVCARVYTFVCARAYTRAYTRVCTHVCAGRTRSTRASSVSRR